MTNSTFLLPFRDDLGFCNILLSALGGDGANMGAKLLFKVGCEAFGLDGGYDARYGSEKKGTPTDVSVRFCEPGTPVRQSGPTNRPHFLVVFHADLIAPLELWRGLHDGAVCIVNTPQSPAATRETLRLHRGRVVCVDGTRIAYESKSRLNMPLIAALCHEFGLPDAQMREYVASAWPNVAASNLSAMGRAIAEAVRAGFDVDERFVRAGPKPTRGAIGWRNMLNGGVIDARTHSTIGRDNRVAGRGRVPHFEPAACNSCGICLTVCSDPGGLLWREGRMAGIDPLFCKGCMRCVEVCPTTKKGHALSVVEAAGKD
ncbi:MAG: 2-oxoacid:acceptor oxidoreductase family protein [Phycisphaerae bacterium]